MFLLYLGSSSGSSFGAKTCIKMLLGVNMRVNGVCVCDTFVYRENMTINGRILCSPKPTQMKFSIRLKKAELQCLVFVLAAKI